MARIKKGNEVFIERYDEVKRGVVVGRWDAKWQVRFPNGIVESFAHALIHTTREDAIKSLVSKWRAAIEQRQLELNRKLISLEHDKRHIKRYKDLITAVSEEKVE